LAIVQISQITNRKGLAENLPQLAGAELGWSTDTRQLFIGNGTLADGAPVIGNTEILTEFSVIPVPSPIVVTLADNTASATTAFTLSTTAATLSYVIIRNNTYRTGTIMVTGVANPLQFDDTSIQNASTGITLTANYLGGQIQIQYTSTQTGFDAQLKYLVTISA
jgi:Major tropism determinant N-terminal domain